MSQGVEERIEERVDAQTKNWKGIEDETIPLEFGECEASPDVLKIVVEFRQSCTSDYTDNDRNSEENQIDAEQQSYFPGDCRLSFHSHVGPGFFGDDEDGDVEKKTGELEDNEGDLWAGRKTNRLPQPAIFKFKFIRR